MRRRTLRGTLGWLLASLIAPIALGTLAVLALESHRSEEVERERLAALVRTLLGAVDAEFARTETLLDVLSRSPQYARGDLEQLHAFARSVVQDLPGSAIALVDGSGQSLLSTDAPWGRQQPGGWPVQDSRQARSNGGSPRIDADSLLRRALDQNEAAYSDLFYSAHLRRPAVAVALPVESPSGTRHVFVMAFAPDELQEMMDRTANAEGVRIAITDRQQRVIASNSHADVRTGDYAGISSEMTAREDGFFRLTSARGLSIEGAFAISRQTGYMVRVAQTSRVPFIPLWSRIWLTVLVLASGVGVGLVFFFARRLAQPIAQLASDLRHGRAPPPQFQPSIVEFQLLAGAVQAAVAAEQFRRSEEARKVGDLQDRALFAEQMVGIVSHDLRNPLLAAQLSVNALQGSPLPPGSRVFLQQVQVAIGRAQGLVHGLLDFTRARLGKGLPVDLAPVDLHQLVGEHVRTLQRSYPEHQLVHEAAGEGACEADAGRLLQVVDNLVNNAATYGDRHRPITIRTAIADGEFRITVHNHGRPVPDALLDRVFQPMVRTHAASIRTEGVGLGLYIVAEIARAHAGEAHITSTATDGTAVTASFPR